MKCEAEHTYYQPSDEELRCPRCGEFGSLYIEEGAEGSAEACELCHVEDEWRCDRCSFATSGGALAAGLEKASKRIKCPNCGGTGWIDKPEDDSE